MKAQGWGRIVNIASSTVHMGVPYFAHYTASKGAVIALTKSLAVQFGPKGIRANAICPGPIETPLLTEWLLKEPAEKAKRINRIPMGRFGAAEDVAAAAVYLASAEAGYITGQTLHVNGGMVMV